ncbi:MAG: DUF1638 domain-containing protein [SAR324 cluster bacterium]|jgi:hypothetical protein
MIGLENQRRRGRNSRKANQDKHTVSLEKWAERLEPSDKILILACGALAKEISALIRLNGWSHLKTRYLPAILHNTPEKITEQLRMVLQSSQTKFSKIFIGYADCGTGGKIDSLLDEFDVQRLPGAHCYEFFAGKQTFAEIMEEEIGSYFLTDFLVKAFEKLVWQGMKIDRHPELLPIYFKHYKKLVYLAQSENLELQTQAHEIAERLGLVYEKRVTGYGELEHSLTALTAT